MPPISAGEAERISTFQPWRSAYFWYMRKTSPANRAASSPPVPARISSTTDLSSLGSRGRRSVWTRRSSSSLRARRPGSSDSASSVSSMSSPARTIDSLPVTCSSTERSSRAAAIRASSEERSFAVFFSTAGFDRTAGSDRRSVSSLNRASTRTRASCRDTGAGASSAVLGRGGGLGGGGAGLGLGVLAAEALDAAGRVQQALLAGEERVAGRADLDVVALQRRRARLVGGVAARAQDRHRLVLRMDRLHVRSPYWFIDSRNFLFVFVSLILLMRNSIASTGFSSFMNLRRIHMRDSTSSGRSSSSLRVPERLRSIAGKLRLSASFRSRTSSMLPVPLNSSKMTSSMREPVSMSAVA